MHGSLLRCARQDVRRWNVSWRSLTDRLGRVRPAQVVKQRRELLHQEVHRLREQIHHRLRAWQDRLTALEAQLRLLGPEQVLARGYSITRDAETGFVLRDARRAKRGQQLRTRLQHGEIISTVDIRDDN